MPALPARLQASSIEAKLQQYDGLGHLRVRARGQVLTIESGSETEPTSHARLRRDTVSLWTLEMPARGGRWEPTGLRDTSDRLVTALVEQFGWALQPIDDSPWEPGTD